MHYNTGMEQQHGPITNKKAFHDYLILERYEAGIVLTGFEVKSLRMRGGTLTDSYVRIGNDLEATLLNAYIPAFQGGKKGYDERRSRKLLLHKTQIKQLYGKMSQSGYALIPLKLYFKHNYAKIEIALAKHKKQFDKRDALKRKTIQRDIERTLRGDKQE